MSVARTHPNGNTRSDKVGNLYVVSFTQGLVPIKFHFLPLLFSKPSVRLIVTKSGKTLYGIPRSATVLSYLHSLMAYRNSSSLYKDVN